MAEASISDADLVASAQGGDVDAYAELVRRYQALAVGLAGVVTRDPANAEDVAQEEFLKAYLALDLFRPGDSFRAWLTRIVANEARNALAASRRRGELHARFSADSASLTVAASAEVAAVANEQHVALLRILDTQREDDRAVLLYRYVFDLSEAEMAEVMACSPGTVKSRLSRALSLANRSGQGGPAAGHRAQSWDTYW
jgi:RNA polymerase sigma factor (sigma-70 family)